MKNSFGTNLALTLFGESHGPAVGCVLDGLAPGLPVEPDAIAALLQKRRALGSGRSEPDEVRILSGVHAGKTTGTPLCILIENRDAKREDYDPIRRLARPGHADYAGFVKYHGFADPSGGGHLSGRLTAPLVAAGAILLPALKARGVLIGTHIASLGNIADRDFADLPADLALLEGQGFAALDPGKAAQMQAAIAAAREQGDSLGGVLETAVLGLPAGIGEPWFDTLEGLLSHALFSIPAVKGVEFGGGFALAALRGSEANDAFRVEHGRIVTATNHNGGINGGVSNGMPLSFRCAVKPTPSIALPQQTVDYVSQAEAELVIRGRHDPAVVHRAAVVASSLTALVLADQLAGRFGTDWLAG